MSGEVERAAEVDAALAPIIERAMGDYGSGWYEEGSAAQALAGLLVTDADRAVLDAVATFAPLAREGSADKWSEYITALVAVCEADEARREAQEVAEQDAYNQAIQWDPTNGGALTDEQIADMAKGDAS